MLLLNVYYKYCYRNVICISQIQSCDECQRMHCKMTAKTPELHPVAVVAPWYHIGIDFIGPISPVASDGSRYIFTVCDYFTKWAYAVGTPNKEASTVSTVLYKVFTNINICTMHVYT